MEGDELLTVSDLLLAAPDTCVFDAEGRAYRKRSDGWWRSARIGVGVLVNSAALARDGVTRRPIDACP